MKTQAQTPSAAQTNACGITARKGSWNWPARRSVQTVYIPMGKTTSQSPYS